MAGQNKASNVVVAVTGGVWRAPKGTPLPTTVDAELDPALWQYMGYIGEDGVTLSIGADSDDIKAWQNGDIVRKVQTSHDVTAQCVFIETKAATLSTFFADPDATVSKIKISSTQPEQYAWVYEVFDGDKSLRLIAAAGQLTERGEINLANAEALGYDCTITFTADPANEGENTKAVILTDMVAEPVGGDEEPPVGP